MEIFAKTMKFTWLAVFFLFGVLSFFNIPNIVNRNAVDALVIVGLLDVYVFIALIEDKWGAEISFIAGAVTFFSTIFFMGIVFL